MKDIGTKAVEAWAISLLNNPIHPHRPADMHIDQLNAHIYTPTDWTLYGLKYFSIACKIRDSLSPADAVCLVFYLMGTEQKRGLCPAKIGNIESDYEVTPPEIVWLRGQQTDDYMSMIAEGTELLNWGVLIDGVRIFYYEHERKYGDEVDFSRNIWIVSAGDRSAKQ